MRVKLKSFQKWTESGKASAVISCVDCKPSEGLGNGKIGPEAMRGAEADDQIEGNHDYVRLRNFSAHFKPDQELKVWSILSSSGGH
jgi:hypothetical protein